MPPLRRICVFCGSRPGARPEFLVAARALGTLLAERRIGVVYGGASIGLMGALADAALAAGGEVIGVIPEALAARELAHGGLASLHVTATMHERKAKMATLADGFIAMPGGFGTFEELFEVITWAQIGIHEKPIGLLDVAGFYAPLLTLLDHAVVAGFVPRDHLRLLSIDADPAALVDALAARAPIALGPKWTDLERA